MLRQGQILRGQAKIVWDFFSAPPPQSASPCVPCPLVPSRLASQAADFCRERDLGSLAHRRWLFQVCPESGRDPAHTPEFKLGSRTQVK